MDLRRGLARSLRLIRKARGLAQSQLADAAGRTYLSEIERGVKNPTVEKIDRLARAMKVHPLTVLTIAYLARLEEKELLDLQERVDKETRSVLSKADAAQPRKARTG